MPEKGLDGFWLPTNQNFDLKPFIFLLENNEDQSTWRLEPTNSRDLTALTNFDIL